MRLSYVLTATNDNPLYIDFIPVFIRAWKKLYPDVQVRILVVADKIPDWLNSWLDNLILFKPPSGIDTGFIAQYIRVLYPSLLPTDGAVMITDMDMIPMNRSYYSSTIEPFDTNTFVYYRGNVCAESREIAMCYNAACPAIWSEIFKLATPTAVPEHFWLRS
jgi:hypothetical protein